MQLFKDQRTGSDEKYKSPKKTRNMIAGALMDFFRNLEPLALKR